MARECGGPVVGDSEIRVVPVLFEHHRQHLFRGLCGPADLPEPDMDIQRDEFSHENTIQ